MMYGLVFILGMLFGALIAVLAAVLILQSKLELERGIERIAKLSPRKSATIINIDNPLRDIDV